MPHHSMKYDWLSITRPPGGRELRGIGLQGQVLDYSIQTNEGIITGDDGERYQFKGEEWRESAMPARGLRVDYGASDGWAMAIYAIGDTPLATPTINMATVPGQKSKAAAGLLSIFLGMWGVHKFYLGYTGTGLLMLGITLLGILLAIVVIGIFMVMAMVTIAIIEGIIYLTKSDEEFHQTYVVNKKSWF